MIDFIRLYAEDFESSSGLTPQFQRFYKSFSIEMRKILNERFNVTDTRFTRGHFYTSGFFRLPDNRIFYLSTGDVRWRKGKMLIRRAKNFHDFVGGSNHFISFENEDVFLSQLQEMLIIKGCTQERGSLACEECDNWVIVKILPKSETYPLGYVVQECELDIKGGEAT